MKQAHRVLALLLSAALSASIPGALPISYAAAPGGDSSGLTGTLSATLRFDYRQTFNEVKSRGISATLYDKTHNKTIGTLELSTGTTQTAALGSYTATVTAKNLDGEDRSDETIIGYYDVSVPNLPAGSYTLKFTGDGYKSYATEAIELKDFSKHIILGTGDATFSIGDLDENGRVDADDVTAMTGALGKTQSSLLDMYDLNGDNKIDIVDLAYVNHQVGLTGGAKVISTTAMVGGAALDTSNLTLTSGTADDLFADNGQAATITASSSAATAGALEIPIDFGSQTVEMQQLEITSPDQTGAVEKGVAVVTYIEDGKEKTDNIPFDNTAPEGLLPIARATGTSTVTISLGKRVPVKKITVRVEQVKGEDGSVSYAVVEQIKFLQDIVPENPTPANTKVKSVSAVPGDGTITLKWPELPNVSGYRVNYGESGTQLSGSVQVDVTSAVVSGLKNLTAYDFTVTPVSEGWQGIVSDVITATPQPASIPSPPDFLSVKEGDGALYLSWHKAKNATGYRVYIKAEGAAAWTQVGGDLTTLQYNFTGLTNGVNYQLCATAFNSQGESGKSKPVEGIPASVSYDEPAGIPTGGRMSADNLERVYLSNAGNVDKTQYPSNDFKIANVADGDYSTHWTSLAYPKAWWSDKTVNFVFKEPVDMNTIVFVPRLDGSYRSNLRLYTITVWYDGDDLNSAGTAAAKNLSVKNNPAVTGFAALPFDLQKNVKKIAVQIEQVGYSAVSLSEIIFYEYDASRDLNNQIDALFTDELRTALQPGVTEEQINELQTQLDAEQNYYLNVNTMKDELKLAAGLLAGDDVLGRIIDGIESRSADSGKAVNGGQGGSALQPLGVSAPANSEITLYASGIPEGAAVNVIATQFNAEASQWQQSLGKLTNGRNVFVVPKIGSQTTQRGGSLYLTYAGEKPEQIRLHIRRATEIPMLQLADWYDLDEASRKARMGDYLDELSAWTAALPAQNIQTQIKNVTEISIPRVLLSIPAKSVMNALGDDRSANIQKLYNNVLAWEELMDIACTTQGIADGRNMEARQNIRCMQMFAGAFMYAAGSHVGIGYGSCSGMVCGSPTDSSTPGSSGNHLFGWGIAHEIGHNMDKLGKAEITNNIYSLMVQTCDGAANTLPSRLEKSNVYTSIYDKTSIGYPGAANNVFTQLGMYWQLHLAYDDAANPLDFYNRFFTAWKADGLDATYSYDEKVALTASRTANRDLSQFFTRWGMRLSDKVTAEIEALPKEDRAIWYLNDESRRYRLAGSPAASGVVTASAQADPSDERQVKVAFSSSADPKTIQGYEIIRNGSSIAFVSASGIYTDVIGSANNQTFRYEVQAYDKLGNAAGPTAEAGEVRIAYDKTIPSSEYTLTRDDDGTITAVFSTTTAISGIKITDGPASGHFTVSVKNDASVEDSNAIVAKEGDLEKSDGASDSDYYLSYFNKPGAPSTDTRIWTYDAAVVTVTGLPADTQLSFISYAGDNIAFGEDVVMGRLEGDYTYDTVTGTETIKAGTLVITGSYRGDPFYNVIEIQGEYTSSKLAEDGGDPVVSTTERPMPGYALLFAEVPEDGQVSDISDGFFLYVPDLQNEAELQPDISSCDAASLLPVRIKAELYRTDAPNSTASKRRTSDTLWIGTPSADSLPQIKLQGVKK